MARIQAAIEADLQVPVSPYRAALLRQRPAPTWLDPKPRKRRFWARLFLIACAACGFAVGTQL